MRKHRAELVFKEEGTFDRPRWEGRLLAVHNTIDEQSGQPVTWQPYYTITEEGPDSYTVEFQGGRHPGSRRYAWFSNLTRAQEHGIRWAKRRFFLN